MRLDYTEIHAFSDAFPGTVKVPWRDIDSGIVAIVGPNGDGKSTLMGAGFAGIHRELPGIDEGLVDWALGRDAYLLNEYSEDGGARVRTRIALDGHARKQKAVIETIDSDGSVHTLNNGLVETFDDLVGLQFASKELLLMGPFACQTREGGFLQQSPAKRKERFAEMIGLALLETKAKTAAAMAAKWEGVRAGLAGQREALRRDADPATKAEFLARTDALQVDLGNIERRREQLQTDLEALEAERAELEDQAAAHRDAVAMIAQLTDHLTVKQRDLGVLIADAESAGTLATQERTSADSIRTAALRDIAGRQAATETEHADAIGAHEARMASLLEAHEVALADKEERLANNGLLIADAGRIQAAVTAKTAAEQTVAGLRGQEVSVRARRDHALREVRDRERRLAALEVTKRELTDARRQTETLGLVPCGGAGDFATCRFLADARAASTRIPDLEQALSQEQVLRGEIGRWQADAEQHEATLTSIGESIVAAQRQIAELSDLAGQAEQLAVAQARIEDLKRERSALVDVEHPRQIAELAAARARLETELPKRVADFEGQRAHVEASYAETMRAIAARLEARLGDLERRRQQVESEFSAARSELSATQTAADATKAAAQRLDVLDPEMQVARAQWTDTDVALATLRERQVTLERDRAAYARKTALLASVEQQLVVVADELRGWAQLAKILGKDGVQTFEIEHAGPAVAAAANELLLATDFSRFTLELVTQTEKAGGKGLKETFDLHVWNTEAGGERKMASLSGGQRAFVDEAFRLAVVIYNNAKNERPFGMLWRDETAGAFDAEAALSYMPMLRRARQMSGVRHLLFVTHNMELAGMADTQVLVANGTVKVTKRSEAELRSWLSEVTSQRREAA